MTVALQSCFADNAAEGDDMIKKVGILGLGALGGMFGEFITKAIGRENVYVIGDIKRLRNYKNNGVFINDSKFDFNYEVSDEKVDLLMVATKYHHLKNALESAKPYINDNTIIISLLNGINSEEVIKDTLKKGRILYCVAYGMDSQKYGNHINFKNYGVLAFGEADNNKISENVRELKDFFDSIDFRYEIPESMTNKLWSKFMLNVGINQVCAAYGLHYKDVQSEVLYRSKMIEAMNEVLNIAGKIKIPLTKDDIDYWLNVIDGLNADSMPSMAQDILNKNKTEVEIFADYVIDLGKRYDVKTPVNIELGNIIHKKEKGYEL